MDRRPGSGGKCFRSVLNREGAFSRYRDQPVEVVGYTTCDGCPGGNVEYSVQEMMNNGAQIIHLATGMIVGYPPCPHLAHFHDFITAKYGLEVVYGTHPIPEKYFLTHQQLHTWQDPQWPEILAPTLTDQAMRLAYD